MRLPCGLRPAGPGRGGPVLRLPLLLLIALLVPGLAGAACPEDVARSSASVVTGLLEGAAVDELDARELDVVRGGRAVVHRMCVPGFANPRYRVFRAVRATPETVAAILAAPADFADRLPLTVQTREVELPSEDPARGRDDVAVRAVRMRYFLVPPFVAEDYTLRFVAGPSRQGGVPGAAVLPGSDYDSVALKWTRLDSRIARHLDGSARFEPLGDDLLLLRYDTFLAFGDEDPQVAYKDRPPGVEPAIRAVVRRIDRWAERAQRIRDADPARQRGPTRALRQRLDALAAEAVAMGQAMAPFPADEPDLLGFGHFFERAP